MNPTTAYWIKLGIIALIDVAVVVWIWKQVKRVDREQEAAEVRRIELMAQIRRSKMVIASLPESMQQRIMREAEALGFRDEDDAA